MKQQWTQQQEKDVHIYYNNSATMSYRELLANIEKLPFSFKYNGKAIFISNLREVDRKTLSNKDKETTDIFFEYDCLKISVKLTHYFTHGATEWTVWFENISNKNSGVLEELQTTIEFAGKDPVLKGILGDKVNRYRPYEKKLTEESVEFLSNTGRATHEFFPYFNLEYGNGGAFIALGWAGTWKAKFSCQGETTTYQASAIVDLCTYLKPGEKIRSALFLMLPYTIRDENYATNLWRSWFIEQNMPKFDDKGTSITPFSTCCFDSDTGRMRTDGSLSETYFTWKPTLEKMIEVGVKVDFRWFDAGWYQRPDLGTTDGLTWESNWWGSVGTWALDPAKWPKNTFRESIEFGHERGIRTLVWFEPDRVMDVDNLVKNWGYKKEWAIPREEGIDIFNDYGNKECFEWVLGRIRQTLTENKIDMYREDFNVACPKINLDYGDKLQGVNRKGITEHNHVDGRYRLWDEIIKITSSYGGCSFVDCCASGGGRNDIESMRRGVPLLRSDADRTTTALRLSMTSSFNKWIPFCGANTKEKVGELDTDGASDVYIWRASYLPCLNIDELFVQKKSGNYSSVLFGMDEWKRVSPYLLKDFYLLTDWHDGEDKSGFTAYAYFDEDTKSGVVFAFRQEDCTKSELTLNLPFAKGEYTLTDEDTLKTFKVVDGMLDLFFDKPRTSKLIWIKK